MSSTFPPEAGLHGQDSNTSNTLDTAREKYLAETIPDIIQGVIGEGILQSNWGELLYAAPMAIEILGRSFVAASSEIAAAVTLVPDKKDRGADDDNALVTLPFKSLQANLMHCGDLGRKSFMEAEARMGKLTRLAGYMAKQNGTIGQIIALLDEPEAARYSLRRQMTRLQDSANSCKDEAEIIEKKFESWFDFTCVLAKVSMEKQGDNEKSKDFNKMMKRVKEDDQKTKRAQEEAIQRRIKELETSLELANNDYRIATAEVDKVQNESTSAYIEPIVAPIEHEPPGVFKGVARFFMGKSNKDIEKEAEAERALRQRVAEEQMRKQKAARERVEDARRAVREAQSGLQTTHKDYSSTTNDLIATRMELNNIQSTLKQIGDDEMTLEKIQIILEKSIYALSKLKQHVQSLASFYKEVAGMVEHAANQPLRDFLEIIEAGILAGGNSPDAQQIKKIKLFEIQKRMLLSTAVQAQAYFSVISEVSKLYVNVSKGHIMPGINKIDELMLSGRTLTGHDHHKKMHELETWAESSKNKIYDISQTKQDEIINNMATTVKRLAGSARIMPSS